jgi:hypothetical protein
LAPTKYRRLQNIHVDRIIGVDEKLGMYNIIGVDRKLGVDKN